MIQIGGVYTTFCQKEGILLQKHRDKNGRCTAIHFKSIGVRGRFDSPETSGTNPAIIALFASEDLAFCFVGSISQTRCLAAIHLL